MRLRIVTPLSVIIDEDIDSLRAEDASGDFGILPGHAPFLTSLIISIVSWKKDNTEQYCALRGGVMTVSGKGSATTLIDIATREAVIGTDLTKLDSDVLAQFQSDADDERIEHTETMLLQMNVIRRMVSRLKTSANAGEFR
jgi:F-type H+-transporting ATPase subunit epsilon